MKWKVLNGKKQIVSLKIDFEWIKHCISIGKWVKSPQLPYSDQENIWPIMVQALISDHFP